MRSAKYFEIVAARAQGNDWFHPPCCPDAMRRLDVTTVYAQDETAIRIKSSPVFRH